MTSNHSTSENSVIGKICSRCKLWYPFPNDIQVVGYHISDGFKVYLPTDLHLNYYTGKNAKLHRDKLKPIIENLYNISYIIDGDN